MRARLTVAAVIGTVVLGLAQPAWAKGIGVVNINGPNLPSGGITIPGNGPAGEELSRLGLFAQTKDRPPWAIGISRPDLGPKYVVEYRLRHFPGGSARKDPGSTPVGGWHRPRCWPSWSALGFLSPLLRAREARLPPAAPPHH